MADILEYQASDAKAKWAELSGRGGARPHRPHHPPRQDNSAGRARGRSARRRGRRGDRAAQGPRVDVRQSAARRDPREPSRGAQILSFVIDASIRRWLRSDENAESAESAAAIDAAAASRGAGARFSSSSRCATRLSSTRREAELRRRVGRFPPPFWRDCQFGSRRCRRHALMALARERNLTVYDAAYLELASARRAAAIDG